MFSIGQGLLKATCFRVFFGYPVYFKLENTLFMADFVGVRSTTFEVSHITASGNMRVPEPMMYVLGVNQ